MDASSSETLGQLAEALGRVEVTKAELSLRAEEDVESLDVVDASSSSISEGDDDKVASDGSEEASTRSEVTRAAEL